MDPAPDIGRSGVQEDPVMHNVSGEVDVVLQNDELSEVPNNS